MNGTLINCVQFSFCGWEKSSFLISISARQRRLRQGDSPWMHPEIRGGMVQIYSRSSIWILSHGFSFDWLQKETKKSTHLRSVKSARLCRYKVLTFLAAPPHFDWQPCSNSLLHSDRNRPLNRPHNSDVRPLIHRAATHQTKASKPHWRTDQKNDKPEQ